MVFRHLIIHKAFCGNLTDFYFYILLFLYRIHPSEDDRYTIEYSTEYHTVKSENSSLYPRQMCSWHTYFQPKKKKIASASINKTFGWVFCSSDEVVICEEGVFASIIHVDGNCSLNERLRISISKRKMNASRWVFKVSPFDMFLTYNVYFMLLRKLRISSTDSCETSISKDISKKVHVS